MAIYKTGQRVELRSGRRGVIRRILKDDAMPHLTVYQVAMDPDAQLIGVEGVNVLRTEAVIPVVVPMAAHLLKRQAFNFTAQESDVLDNYTGPKFKEWNRALRAGNAGEHATSINLLTSLLGKITPKWSGTLFRGLLFTDKPVAFLAGFTTGQEYMTPQFMSTS